MPMPQELQDEMQAREDALDAEQVAQISLLPDTIPDSFAARVPLDTIDVPASTPAATTDLIDSVTAFGVMQPVALRVAEFGRHEVIEGRRRVLAARAAGLVVIPALVFPQDTPRSVISAMTLTGNFIRRANPLAELEAIEQLVSTGASETDISQQLGISRQTLQARLRLGRLIPRLRDLLADGTMAPAVADLAARLDVRRQSDLVAQYEQRVATGGRARITASEVRQMREAIRQAVTSSLPDEMFTPAAPAVDTRSMIETRAPRYVLDIEERDPTDVPLRMRLEFSSAEQYRYVRQDVAQDAAAATVREFQRHAEQERDRLVRELADLSAANATATDSMRARVVELEAQLAAARADFVRASAAASERLATAVTPADLPEGWTSVYTLLGKALEAVPVSPDPSTERMYQAIQEIIDNVRPSASAEEAAARPAAAVPLEAAVAAVGGVGFDASQLRVRGLPMFGRARGQYFQRYIDAGGSVRRYYFPNSARGEQSYRQSIEIAQRQAAQGASNA